MPGQEEKVRRKALRKAMREQERAREEASLPMAIENVHALFDHVQNKLESEGCDDTLRHTHEFLDNHGYDVEAVTDWLHGYGGFCDCEILLNVEERWGKH